MRAEGSGEQVRALIAVVAALVSHGACAPAVREVVRDSIDENAKRENWEKLREPARGISTEIAKGMAAAVLSPETQRKVAQAIDEYVRTFVAAVSDEAGKDLSPKIAEMVRSSVRAAIQETLDDGAVHRAEDVVDRMAFAAFSGLSRGISGELRDDLGPAVADVLRADLGPAMRDVISQNFGPGLAATLDRDLIPAIATASRRASTAAAEGFMDGLKSRVDPLLDHAVAKLDFAMTGAQQSARSIAELVVVIALAIVATCFGFGLVLVARRARSRHDALHLVVREISSMSNSSAIQELARRINQAGSCSRGGDYLEAHLRRHPELRVNKLEKLA